VKRTGKDKPIVVAIHICMETIQGNSLCSYLYLKVAKTLFLFLSFMFFLLQNRRTGGWRMNMVQITYAHVCKCKNDSCETVPGIRREGMKQQWISAFI
jgi:hypothetical protein